MNDGVFYLALAFCLVHLIGSPIMSAFVEDDNRFASLYVLCTAGVCLSIMALFYLFLPRDMGISGIGYLLPLGIPIVFTTPVVLILRVACRVIR